MLGILPADENALYETPVVTAVATSVANAVRLVTADPSRVSLLIALGTATTTFVFPGEPNALASGGILINNASVPVMQFSYIDHPALCQCAWSVQTTPGGGNITVVTVSLRRSPRMYGYDVFRERLEFPPEQQSLLPARYSAVGGRRRKLPGGILQALRQRAPYLFNE